MRDAADGTSSSCCCASGDTVTDLRRAARCDGLLLLLLTIARCLLFVISVVSWFHSAHATDDDAMMFTS